VELHELGAGVGGRERLGRHVGDDRDPVAGEVGGEPAVELDRHDPGSASPVRTATPARRPAVSIRP
jgi:hypothetical protein